LAEPLLLVRDLKKYFPIRRGFFQRAVGVVRAVDGITFSVEEGEIVGLAGESGSGKSTVAKTLVRIYKPTSGEVHFKGQDISNLNSKDSLYFKKEIQMVFQNPYSSLNPRRNVKQILDSPLRVHKVKARLQRIKELLEMVKLPQNYMYKYPHALSGGERQRVAIARALAPQPSFIVLDEPTSALDVSVQAKIIDLLMNLREEFNFSYLFISHDLSLMRNIATRTAVMYLGKICEIAPSTKLFHNPLHPYSRMLLSAIPVVSKAEEELKPQGIKLEGEVPSPVRLPSGCRFHPRCEKTMEICSQEGPKMVEVNDNHFVTCHLYNDCYH
jgi:peptide/nickel transport system ATP-binding protein